MKKVNEKIAKVIVYAAMKAAKVEANTTCAFLGYQPEVPKELKSLRKF